jgi:hypothetical protein
MGNEISSFDQILKLLTEKAPLKIEVYNITEKYFNLLKTILKNLEVDIKSFIDKVDSRVEVKYTQRGTFDLEFKISDDILIFSMHTDTYTFPENHNIWKSGYVNREPLNSYCGMISVYNFLTDSLKFDRPNDLGILIGRLFINREHHFFVEGKRQLGFLFNDLEKDLMEEKNMRKFAETAILYSLNYDIHTPPFDEVKMISVGDLREKNLSNVVSTGKRLGFKLQSDTDSIG